jgi:hypothetical protein
MLLGILWVGWGKKDNSMITRYLDLLFFYEDVPFLNEPLICEDYQDQGYSCVEGNKCQISECSASMDQRSTDPGESFRSC